MTQYYLDTSALVKRYIEEMGTRWVQAIHDPRAPHTRWVVRISAVECIAAIFRRVRTGELALPDAHRLQTRFRADFEADYRIVDVTPVVIDRAMVLAAELALRGYDAVQLAAADLANAQFVALGASPITFVSADDDLNNAAQLLGLTVANPNLY